MKIYITKNEIKKQFNVPEDCEIVIEDSTVEDKTEYWTITDKANEKTSEIIARCKKLFPVSIYKEEDIDTQCPAPDTDITVSFKKSYEPDEEHLGKPYNNFMAETDKTYMTMRQYLYLVLLVWETEKKNIDIKGLTRTNSCWSDGVLVCGYWRPGSGELRLGGDDLDNRNPECGPRQQFFV